MSRVRRALSVVLVAFAALAFSSCKVDTQVDLTVKPDGSGTVVITATADKELVDKAPGLAEDLRFDDATAAGWQVQGPTTNGDGSLTVVLAHPFTNVQQATVLLQSLNGNDGPLHDVVVGHTVTDEQITTTLSGSIRVANGLDAFADPDVLAAIGGSPYADELAQLNLRPADVITFTFTADLPGDLATPDTAASGSTVASAATSAQSLTWTVPMDGTNADLASTAVLAQGSGSGGVWNTVANIALVALIVWVVASVGFIAFVAKARRERARRRSLRA